MLKLPFMPYIHDQEDERFLKLLYNEHTVELSTIYAYIKAIQLAELCWFVMLESCIVGHQAVQRPGQERPTPALSTKPWSQHAYIRL
jgi:hypothetical protein